MALNDVQKTKLIEKAAEELKNLKEIAPPAWAPFVKTGMSKERPPVRKDWWHVRAAAVLAKLDKLGPVGVSKLRKKYGSRKNKGHKPSHVYKGSANIIRKILQQLEKAGLAKQVEKGIRKGRVITPKGLSLLGKVSNALTPKNG
ncbi:30S ribosomal protein S19e [Candidatus Woesearchaeota archaeon]|nr:30S ribosomal protein S19e [Candidatus Woesearchaeota archaeon]